MRDIRSVMAPLRLPGRGSGWRRARRIEGEEQAAVRRRLGGLAAWEPEEW